MRLPVGGPLRASLQLHHGFVTVPFEMNVSPLLHEPELQDHVHWHADKWYVFGELLPTFDRTRHGPALQRVQDRVARAPHIARVIRPDRFEGLGDPITRTIPMFLVTTSSLLTWTHTS